MTIALYALAAAMMIGGIASVIQGFPFVRLESGLAMTIAGATVAAAGAVLLGLGAVVAALKRVEGALGFRRLADEARPAEAVAGAPVPVPEVVAPPVPTAPPLAALAGSTIGGLALGEAASRAGREPVFDGSAFGTPSPRDPALPGFEPADFAPLPPEPEHAVDHAEHEARNPEVEPELPLPAPHASEPLPEPSPHKPDAPQPEPERAMVIEEDDLFVAPAPLPAPLPEAAVPPVEPAPAEEEAPALRPALTEEEPLAEPEPSVPHEIAPQHKPAARDVVGTYASGGNTYVMYSDGAIEADTPRGRFTFGSLDELKAFVDGGGEADRGAA